MVKQVLSALLTALVTLIIATGLIFLLVRLSPSDPITLILKQPGPSAMGISSEVTERRIEEAKKEAGLDQPLPIQYVNWLKSMVKGDMGKSYFTGRPVSTTLKEAVPNSIVLALVSVAIEVVLALIAASVSVLSFGRFWDRLIRLVTIGLRSVPFFAVSIIALQVFSVKWPIYSIQPGASWSKLWLPALVIGLTQAPRLTRIIRLLLLDQVSSIHSLDSMAKGYSRLRIIKNAIRESALPLWTQICLSLAGSLGGLVAAESLFIWPGVGQVGMDAAIKQDYPLIQSYIFVTVLMVIVINLVNDAVAPLISPSLRRREERS